MVKVVDGGQCAAARARFSPGVRTGLHLVAAEATDTPRPIAIETDKTSKCFLKVPPLTSLSPLCPVCLMSGAPASTHKLYSCTRIAHCPGLINHQLPCCGARPVGIIRKREEVTIILKDSRSQPGRLRGVGPRLCGRGLPRNPIRRSSHSGDSRKLNFHFTEFSEVRYPQATPKLHQRSLI